MSIFLVTITSLTLATLLGFFLNNVFNHGFGFLKDNESFLNKYVLFQVILPSFLLSFSLFTMIFEFSGLYTKAIQLITYIYISVFFTSIYLMRKMKRRIKIIKIKLISEIIEPWVKKVNQSELNYNLNLYRFNNEFKGELVVYFNRKLINPELIEEIKKKLIPYNISIHFREKGAPQIYSVK